MASFTLILAVKRASMEPGLQEERVSWTAGRMPHAGTPPCPCPHCKTAIINMALPTWYAHANPSHL